MAGLEDKKTIIYITDELKEKEVPLLVVFWLNNLPLYIFVLPFLFLRKKEYCTGCVVSGGCREKLV